ncbi:hypothetical protein IscW_ISCW001380 [Ixodes scapularis]|uniref:Uncharacterized protein n=1 Tax=Ixodes scapularis TaxID=6945 RepID=B7P4C5_IXOSC|nr:hypothetical protein IscW_ISCW001380 [Ixodes scapularis]|eukprot:XP_002405784.1 hypothetical protein IscW_ISCW001380 [Ixodes scapularis]
MTSENSASSHSKVTLRTHWSQIQIEPHGDEVLTLTFLFCMFDRLASTGDIFNPLSSETSWQKDQRVQRDHLPGTAYTGSPRSGCEVLREVSLEAHSTCLRCDGVCQKGDRMRTTEAMFWSSYSAVASPSIQEEIFVQKSAPSTVWFTKTASVDEGATKITRRQWLIAGLIYAGNFCAAMSFSLQAPFFPKKL